jgi:Uncharacterized protein conserved in bacteria
MKNNLLKQMDAKELELPDTTFIRDIETRVFQSIAVQCLSRIDDIALLEGNILDNLLGQESVKGIHVEQEEKTHSVKVKVEVNVVYGVSIPEKAEEIQSRIAEDISRLTELHVSSVHVVFKDVIPAASRKEKEEN